MESELTEVIKTDLLRGAMDKTDEYRTKQTPLLILWDHAQHEPEQESQQAFLSGLLVPHKALQATL